MRSVPMFLFISLILLLVLTFYCSFRGYQALRPLSQIAAVGYIVTFVVLLVSCFGGLVWGADMPPALGKSLTLFGYSYIIIFVYLLISFLVVDIFRLINHFSHVVSPAVMLSVRQWAFAVTVIATLIAFVVGNYRFNHPEIVHLEINTEKLHQGKTVRIVMASDLHLGVTIDKKRVDKFVRLINEQQPDIVLFAGDVVDRQMEPLVQQRMDEELRRIQASLGVYTINGNHEYISDVLDEVEHFMEKAGIISLRDAVCLVDSSFYLIGRDDYSNKHRKQLVDLVDDLNNDLPRIMLDHQPYNLSEAEQNNIDLQLSGHTHAGQFFPINLIVNQMYELPHGYKKKGNTHYFVSSGLGIWGPPFRIGTQSEIVVIDMKM